MRIRQVKPEFWRDPVVAEMDDTTRLVYIGLWMEADDSGTLRTDTVQIAMDLYPLTPRDARERTVLESVAVLVAARRVVVMDCGRHAAIPTLTEHQRLSAPEKRVLTIAREHEAECIPAETRGDPRATDDAPRLSKGEGKGRVYGKVGATDMGGTGATPLVQRARPLVAGGTRE